MIRELKVLGSEVDIGRAASSDSAYQHRGFGKALVARAEESAMASGHRQLYVMSAIGTREYYRKLGFVRAGPHMAKRLFA